MGKTSITVTDERLERFNRLKDEASEDGVPDLSADQFLASLMDTWDAVDRGHYSDAPDMDGVESALATIEERTGRIERQVEELGGGR